MSRLFERIFSVFTVVQRFSLIAMCLLVFWQVAMRELFGIGIQWVYEASCFFQVTMVWLGVPILMYRDENIRITALYNKFPRALKQVAHIIYYLIYVACFAMLCVAYYSYIDSLGAMKSTILRIPNSVFFGSIGLGIFMSVGVILYRTKSLLTVGDDHPGETDTEVSK